MSLSNADFLALLSRLFPDRSTKRAGRFLDVTQRAVQRWVQEGPVPRNIMSKMQDQAEKLDAAGFVGQLDKVVDDALKSDIHPEVIAARLAQHHAKLSGREIE